jgi:hypothetical protein
MPTPELLSIGKAVFSAASKAYRTDRANRYGLREPWTLPLLNLDLKAYDGRYIRIVPDNGKTRVTVLPYDGDVCDGASFAPDSPKGAIPGALFHDPWYAEAKNIAKAWGWSEDAVLRIGDRILSTIMLRAGGNHVIARVYFNAVWYLGSAFRRVRKVLPIIIVVASALCLAGCTSCLSPPDESDPDSPYVPPVYERTQPPISINPAP